MTNSETGSPSPEWPVSLLFDDQAFGKSTDSYRFRKSERTARAASALCTIRSKASTIGLMANSAIARSLDDFPIRRATSALRARSATQGAAAAVPDLSG